jgi:hypothetical protein
MDRWRHNGEKLSTVMVHNLLRCRPTQAARSYLKVLISTWSCGAWVSDIRPHLYTSVRISTVASAGQRFFNVQGQIVTANFRYTFKRLESCLYSGMADVDVNDQECHPLGWPDTKINTALGIIGDSPHLSEGDP